MAGLHLRMLSLTKMNILYYVITGMKEKTAAMPIQAIF